jgi:hypothetical protein
VQDYASVGDALDQFLDSEKRYIQDGLRVLHETFELRLKTFDSMKRTILTKAEIAPIFQNCSQIYEFNQTLYKDLLRYRLAGQSNLLNNLGRTLKQYVPFFKLYSDYIKNTKAALRLSKKLKSSKASFRRFLLLNEMVCGHELAEYVSLPQQRLPQYLEYLQAIKQKARIDDMTAQGRSELNDAIHAIVKVAGEIAIAKRDALARQRVIYVQEKILKGTAAIISPSRLR